MQWCVSTLHRRRCMGKNELLGVQDPVCSVWGSCRLDGGSAHAPPCRLLTTRCQRFSGHSGTQLKVFLSTSRLRRLGRSGFCVGGPPRALTSRSQSSLPTPGLPPLHCIQSPQPHFQPQLPVPYPSPSFSWERMGASSWHVTSPSSFLPSAWPRFLKMVCILVPSNLFQFRFYP